jgi:prepilin-type N-terminal cleavage/methylation domain-containing protein
MQAYRGLRGRPARHSSRRRLGRAARRPTPTPGFTLLELLVVLAMIAILAATGMPALNAALDRARVAECRTHLACIALALSAYRQQKGTYPARLEDLLAARLITDPAILRCSKTGALYYYQAPPTEAGPELVAVACVNPATPRGKRPHARGDSLLLLHLGGQVEEWGRR